MRRKKSKKNPAKENQNTPSIRDGNSSDGGNAMPDQNKSSSPDNSTGKCNEVIKIVIVKQKRDWVPIGVNIVMAIITFLLFRTATTQSDAALRAVKESIKADSIVTKQFEIENTPYLNMRSFEITKIKIGDTLIFNYTINNLGNYPVRVFKTRIGYFLTNEMRTYDTKILLDSIGDIKERVAYVSKEVPLKAVTGFIHWLKPEQIAYFKADWLKLYCFGEVEYMNPVDQRKRKYSFLIRFPHPGKTKDFIYLKNDNDDFPSTK